MNPAWITAALALATAVITIIFWVGRWTWKILSRVTRFLDDFFGTPATDDTPAKPGVMARLSRVEINVQQVVAETKPNNGSSLRDVVHKISADVEDLKENVTEAHKEINSNTAALDHLTGRVELFEQQREDREGRP